MTASRSVLEYDRPLAPGTVRITRAGAAISIKIAPDTPVRTLLTVLVPATLAAGALALAGYQIIDSGTATIGVAVLLALLGAGGGLYVQRAIRAGGDPIVFTADPSMLRIQNALDHPPDQIIGVFEIATLRVRRLKVPTGPYQLEVLTKDLPDRQAKRLSLLVSPNLETLDYIGRTLVRAMDLPEPLNEFAGWCSNAGEVLRSISSALPSTPSPPAPPPTPPPVPPC